MTTRGLKTPVLASAIFLALLTARAQSSSLITLHTFASQNGDGANPYATVVVGTGGVLYGTTSYGGSNGYGTVYQLTPPSGTGGKWTEAILHSFTYTDGAYPYSGLILGFNGNLYGTTTYGGNAGLGTVFELSPPGTPGGMWTQSVLYNFSGPDGANPYAALAAGANGVYYGTTELGGASNNGTVFDLTSPSVPGNPWTLTTLHSFTGGNDGSYPYAGLAVGKSGVLYGTTNFGGPSNDGTVFKLTPPTSGGAWTEAVLRSFTGGGDGGNPYSGVVIASNGALYGTTSGGIGTATGTVFSLSPPSTKGGPWTEKVLYRFGDGADGGNPHGGLLIAKSGSLYGTTFAGGNGKGYSGHGTIYQVTPPAVSGGAWTETVLYTFSGGADGAYPDGALVPASNGTYYCTTLAGGLGRGIVFNFTP